MTAKSLLAGLILTGMLLAGSAGANETRPSGDGRILAKATFAGGCFWCMEEVFEQVGGVVSVTSGYTGGQKKDPTYEQVSAGITGHAEAVEVLYDPAKVTYAKLLEIFWRNIDPTTPNQQFCDFGTQYRPAIFFHDETQKGLADDSKKTVEKTKAFRGDIITQIVPASAFYPAEDYHQNFYKKNPIRYKFYKYNCGRAQRLAELWGPS
jgi:peptide-methionine (S)-S-oxide reductase